MDNLTGNEPDLERDTVPVTPTGTSTSAFPVSSSGRRVWFERGSSWYWPLINLVSLLAVIGVNFLANWIPFNNQTTGEVITKDPIFFQPAGWAFVIWGLIYALLLVFAGYSLLPGGRRSRRVRRIGPFFLVANIANIVWLLFWHWEQFLLTVVFMGILLLSLIVCYILARTADGGGREPTRVQRFVIQIPFSVYLGWITVASIANVLIWLDRRGWNGGPFSLQVWAVIMILVGLGVAAGIALFLQDAAYPLVFAWAYIAIAQQQWSDSKLVSIVAAIGAVVAAALTVFAFMLSFDRRAMSGLYSRTNRNELPPPE